MHFADLAYGRTPLLRPQVGQRVRMLIAGRVRALGTVRAVARPGEVYYHEIELDPSEDIPPSWLERPMFVRPPEVIELDPVE
jgi:hypothetical protein